MSLDTAEVGLCIKVLGRRRADGSSLIKVEEIKDGIVAFEDEADAHRYAAMLEAEGTEVSCYASSALFAAQTELHT